LGIPLLHFSFGDLRGGRVNALNDDMTGQTMPK